VSGAGGERGGAGCGASARSDAGPPRCPVGGRGTRRASARRRGNPRPVTEGPRSGVRAQPPPSPRTARSAGGILRESLSEAPRTSPSPLAWAGNHSGAGIAGLLTGNLKFPAGMFPYGHTSPNCGSQAGDWGRNTKMRMIFCIFGCTAGRYRRFQPAFHFSVCARIAPLCLCSFKSLKMILTFWKWRMTEKWREGWELQQRAVLPFLSFLVYFAACPYRGALNIIWIIHQKLHLSVHCALTFWVFFPVPVAYVFRVVLKMGLVLGVFLHHRFLLLIFRWQYQRVSAESQILSDLHCLVECLHDVLHDCVSTAVQHLAVLVWSRVLGSFLHMYFFSDLLLSHSVVL